MSIPLSFDKMLVLVEEINDLVLSFMQLCPVSERLEQYTQKLVDGSEKLIAIFSVGPMSEAEEMHGNAIFAHDSRGYTTSLLVLCHLLSRYKSDDLLSHHHFLLEQITGRVTVINHALAIFGRADDPDEWIE